MIDPQGVFIYENHPICCYSGELGPKLKEGDRQAPEGFYQVEKSQMNPNSRYHRICLEIDFCAHRVAVFKQRKNRFC